MLHNDKHGVIYCDVIDVQANAWPFSVFTQKIGFWLSYCEISTDLNKILHTPIVVQDTLVGRLRPRLARGRLQAKSERLCFFLLILVTSGVFRGGLVRGPPFGRTAVIFVTILGLFLAPFREKIAAISDQMRFFGRKML